MIGGSEPAIDTPHVEFSDHPVLEFFGLIAAVVALALVCFWFFVVFSLPAHAGGIPCDLVIERAKGLTIEQAMKRAESYGLTKKQLAEVKACLKEKAK